MMKSNIKKQTIITSKQKTDYVYDIIFTLIVFFIMIIIVVNPKRFSSGTIQGIKLFFNSVLPGLFPFMLLTKIMTEIGVVEKIFSKFNRLSFRLFGTPGISLYVLFMSIISGYPIGAKIIADLYNKKIISEQDAKKMSIFCTTSGPIFVIGAIGTIMFSSYKIGLIIYLSHIFSGIVLGILFNLLLRKKFQPISQTYSLDCEKKSNIISLAISETISSLFIVGAYITIFFLIGEILDYIKVFYILEKIFYQFFKIIHIETKYIKGILYGILEVTRGAKTLSVFADKLSITFVTGILSFSGLSIIFQSMSFLKQAKIKTKSFIFYKILHAIISMILCYLTITIFNV